MSTEHTPDFAGGFVPRLGADPSAARYELLTAAQATERVAAVGFDRADAARIVEQYLAQNIAAFGPGPGDGWRVDPYDLAEIARAYDWVDHYRGETIADARTRAAGYAVDFQRKAETVDRGQDPGYAARVDREAAEWADRARDGHNPWPAPDPRLATADGVVGDLTEDEERAAVEAVSGALHEDGDGDQDGDGGVRGPDDGPQPVPLATPDTATQDADTDGPNAATSRADGRAGEERDEVGAGRDDPAAVAWWAPTGPGEVTLSHAEVVAELTHAGMTADQAGTALTRYLDDTSREVGVPVHRWGMDLHDVEAIAHTHHVRQVVEVPEQRDPANRSERDQARGNAAAALNGRPADVEDRRREQLIRWHGDDRAHTDGHGDDGPVRACDDFAPTGATTAQEW